jgi:hypothetical protein
LVKKLLITLFLSITCLFADLLDEKIKNLVDKDSYLVHQKLIDVIFKNKSKFYLENQKVDIVKVAKYLKDSGLLKLFFQEPKSLSITFNTNHNPIFFMKLITDSLNSMGYYFFVTKTAKQENNIFSWKINLIAEYVIDPTIFSKELNKRDCYILDIIKNSKYDWEYVIDISKAKILEAQEISLNRYIKLDKSISDYWIKLNIDGFDLKLTSQNQNQWYPYIAFYDDSLNLLGLFKKDDEVIDSLNVKIPRNCRYVKISDIYSLNNIKNGFTVYLKGDE